MLDLHDALEKDWSKFLFVGMGNRIRSDDGVGIYIAEKLIANGLENVFNAENSIENYIGKINRHPADTVVIIDAVDQEEEPGYFSLLPISEIRNTTANTHTISLDTLSSFLTASSKWILAIQPGIVSIGFDMSGALRKTADSLIEEITQRVIKNKNPILL